MERDDRLTRREREILLEQARYAITCAVRGLQMAELELGDYPPRLQAQGVVFVTLTIDGKLRGCVGALEAYQPLINDVRTHAIAAAQKDYRFQPVTPDELAAISIEISRLTPAEPLDYDDPDDLLNKLCPGMDGVVLTDGIRRATFLPQVWEKLSTPTQFLEHLCQKMGVPADQWRHQNFDVFIYRVEEFHE